MTIQEKCGVVAVCGNNDAIFNCLIGLHALQHRGHEAFGIASTIDNTAQMQICNKVGTVMQSIADFPVKKGLYAIGHVRYSTSGGLDFCQPVYAKTNLGEIAVAHNGNLTNAEKLRQILMQKGRLFKSDVDTEVFVHLIAESKKKSLLDRLMES